MLQVGLNPRLASTRPRVTPTFPVHSDRVARRIVKETKEDKIGESIMRPSCQPIVASAWRALAGVAKLRARASRCKDLEREVSI